MSLRLIKLLAAVTLMLVSTIVFADEATQAKIDALNARIQRIERVLDNQALLSMARRIQVLQREVQELRGKNEQLAHELNVLKSQRREQYSGLERRPQSSSDVQGAASDGNFVADTGVGVIQDREVTQSSDVQTITPTVSTSSQVAKTSIITLPTTVSSDVARDYKNAFALLKQGKYNDAIVAFRSFLQTYPGSKYAANAQYWLAEAHYVSKHYPQALAEFSKVVDTYPASSKVADAKLKLGFTHYELGQYEEARTELIRLRAQFPNSSVASLAQQRLERISREGH